MGSTGSKAVEKSNECSEKEKIDRVPSDPVLTPSVSRFVNLDDLDPRSPSKCIIRTPIELASLSSVDKSDLLNEANEPVVTCTETPLKRHFILGIDPRSPTVEIQRTPIVVNACPDKCFPQTIRNKNLEKVKNIALPMTSTAILPNSPKLLSSNIVTPKMKTDVYKRKSVGLLETNIDYTETDIDDTIRRLTTAKLTITDSSNQEEINDPLPETPESACVKELDECVVINTNNSECLKVIIEDVLAEIINQIPIESIQSLPEEDLEAASKCDVSQKLESSVICQEDDDSCISSEICILPETLTEPPKIRSPPLLHSNISISTPTKSKSQPVTPSKIDLTADIRELDKKLTNLIYEDVDPIICPRAITVKDQNRTPLGPRNGDEHKKSTIQKLKVKDKPRKSDNAVSRIPVFKEKKIKVQCENTPPNGMRITKPKKPQWDPKDKTMVI
ncbi:hypothetical protein ABEB36_002795 [Hypothenemus hampei]|uniref:Uncharacterized protein n=1 Tax=Hypothenemus hampei TaxID=57062 RepID=A0ABD1F7N5_HYPHA